jgi:hypothetical protein
MYGVRLGISAFILVIIAVLVRGWFWSAAHQPASQSTASRAVLTLAIGGSIIGLGALWRRKTQ